MVRLDVQEMVGKYLTEMMNGELTHFLGREPYERRDAGEGEGGSGNYRNGSYTRRFTLKGIGEVSAKVPRDRDGDFQTLVLPRSKQYESEIGHDLCLMFLGGVSTRTLSMMSERLIGRKISHTEISQANSELKGAVERWRNRDLSKEPVKYLFIDGVNFEMRMGDSVEKVPRRYRGDRGRPSLCLGPARLPLHSRDTKGYGLSWIASAIPANRNVELPGKRVFRPGDINELCAKIHEFIDKPLNKEERRKQVDMIAEKYDWEKIAERTIEVYRIIKNRSHIKNC